LLIRTIRVTRSAFTGIVTIFIVCLGKSITTERYLTCTTVGCVIWTRIGIAVVSIITRLGISVNEAITTC
jgi:hypothetical protein